MELYETNKYYIIINGTVGLFCDRLSGHINISESDELTKEWNPVCLGQIHGIIGKINFVPNGEQKLLLISKVDPVGKLPLVGQVYRVKKVCMISLSVQPISNLDIDLCKNHHFGISKPEKITTPPDNQKQIFKAFQDHMKSAAESVKPKRKDIRDNEKFERRMLEEFEKMFHDGSNSSDSFYVCSNSEVSCDITSNIQRQQSNSYSNTDPLWRRADDRFFWNKSMLQEAIDSADRLLIKKFGKQICPTNNEARTMIRDLERMLMPTIQGFVQVEPFNLHVPNHSPTKVNLPNLPQNGDKHEYELSVAIISRRSRYRAGTRFRRRGVDLDGNVANYVETEQILQVENEKSPHIVSFVQVRGSVPVFWSQFSLKYRPPIILEKSEEENQAAFKKHFAKEFERYEKVVVVNLADTGPERSERTISDAYLHHLIKLNSPMITCVLFDFHDYCRGLQFDNVSILMKGVTEIFRDMKYTWVDKNGMICEQTSLFRVNCVDCLDRTNVVQCMLAGVVIETQLRKLGLLSPDESLPNNFHQIMQLMWANNGDAISRHYAGTAAMKGDFTRTGIRTMNGLMKDGVSSVNRYYLRLREMSRQAALDIMTGNNGSTEVISLRNGRSDTEQKLLKQKETNIKELASQCKKACLSADEECLAESILIHCDENEKEFHDMNTVALITSKMLYFIGNLIPLPNYRIEFQQKRQPLVIALPLEQITKIQIGYEPMLFRSNQPMIRVFYNPPKSSPDKSPNNRSRTKAANKETNIIESESASDSRYLAFKQPILRLFNNLLLDVKTNLDMVDALKAVAKMFFLTAKTRNPSVLFDETMIKFEKLKTKPIPTKWTFPIDINVIYENVILSSSFGALNYEYDELMHSREDAVDGLEAGEYDSQAKSKQTMKPIDMIKQSLIRVKDKVTIRDWRDRLRTFSSRHAPTQDSKKDTSNESTETFDIDPTDRLGGDDTRWSSSDVYDHVIRQSLTNENISFLSASCDQILTKSDDENARMMDDQFSSYTIKKVKSEIINYNSPDATFQMVEPFNSSIDEDNLENDPSKDNPFQKVTNHQMALMKCTSYNNVEKLTKDVTMTRGTDMVLESCGILNTTSIRTIKFDNSLSEMVLANAQLAAATGGAYQRRAERISLQLSVDESQVEPWSYESVSVLPLLSRRQILQQALKESLEDSDPSPGDEDSHDFIDISKANGDNNLDTISYIEMPQADIRDAKMAQRFANKQHQLALFVVSLRRMILAPDQSLFTKMIIF